LFPGRQPSASLSGTALSLALTGLISLGLGLAFAYSQPGLKLDGALFDGLVRAMTRPQPSDRIVVVLIGEKDYQSRATPLALWGLHLAPLMNALAQARPAAVGLDLVLPRFPLMQFVKQHDRLFFTSLRNLSRSCRLVSGYGLDPAGRPVQPFVIYQRIIGSDNYGYFNLTPDFDGVNRRQTVALAGSAGQEVVSFAARLAGQHPVAGTVIVPDWRRPARFKTLTLDQALAADPAVFRDRLVLIGFDFDFQDRHATPLDTGLPGVLFQAQAVQTLMTGRELIDPGRPISLLVPALIALAVGLALTARPTVGRTAILALALILGLTGLTAAGLAVGMILCPSAGMAAAVFFAAARLASGYSVVNATFGRHVSPQVRDRILAGDIPLDGEVRQVTALFSDLRNFTPLVESNDPKVVIRILNGYFEAMATAIQAHGGTVLQYVGDEIYAVFGAPGRMDDHAQRAVAAGLAMRRALADYNRILAGQGRPPLDHGIGAHTGPAVAAVIGGGGRVKYALVGDTINLASRLQGLNKQLGTKFIISQETRSQLDDRISVIPLPTVPIKGKKQPVEIFSVPDPD